MQKYILKVDGMQCGMCEAHINDAIRQAFAVKKETSSRKKKETVILSEQPLNEQALRDVIQATGYTLVSVTGEAVVKKGFFH